MVSRRRRTLTAPPLALLGLSDLLLPPLTINPQINSSNPSSVPGTPSGSPYPPSSIHAIPGPPTPLLELKASHQFAGQVDSLDVLCCGDNCYLMVSQPGGEYVALDAQGHRVEPFSMETAPTEALPDNPYLRSLNEANSFTVTSLFSISLQLSSPFTPNCFI